ncbi:MAG TPA: alpha/beta family hydrolase [Bryobacteraceae bacterium]|nr:alpha/beta family hydrolase [Bryobacteraceae bacterium]
MEVLHTPDAPIGDGLVLTHGAGSNCNAPLLVALADAFCATGFAVLRCDLAFREARPHGPPFPAMAAQDRAGLARAVRVMRERVPGKVFLGGHSYGGRQASMLAAEEPDLLAGLMLLSYPLHPPQRPGDLRTAHFPKIATPALFVHGTRDPFGSVEEMRAALLLIAGPHEIVVVEGAGHDLGGTGSYARVAGRVVAAFREFGEADKQSACRLATCPTGRDKLGS